METNVKHKANMGRVPEGNRAHGPHIRNQLKRPAKRLSFCDSTLVDLMHLSGPLGPNLSQNGMHGINVQASFNEGRYLRITMYPN